MSREPRYVDANFAPLFLNTTACEQIKFMPTAQDVVKVVRCKDCKYAIENQAVFGIADYKCSLHSVSRFDAEDYCSYGKRKKGE